MYIVYDLETSGLSPNTYEIIQVAALTEDRAHSFESFVRPTKEVTNWEFHGVTKEDLLEAPKWATVAHDFIAWLLQFEEVTLVAHNGFNFDMKFLIKGLKAVGCVFPKNIIAHTDTLVAYRKVGGYKKNAVNSLHVELCGGNGEQVHKALEDCEMLLDVMEKSSNEIKTTLAFISRQRDTDGLFSH